MANTYNYFTNLDINALYQKVLSHEEDRSALENLSKNLVPIGKQVFKLEEGESFENMVFSKELRIDHTGGIVYTNTIGYVEYKKNKIEFYPLIYVDEQNLKCLAILSAKKNDFILTQIDLERALTYAKVKINSKDNLIQNILDRYNFDLGGEVTLSVGVKPINSRKEAIDFLEDIEKDLKLENSKDTFSLVDYPVMKGDIIATFSPAIKGVPGKSISGEDIPPKEEIVSKYQLSVGCTLDKNKGIVYSEKTGFLTLKNNIISINGVKEINESIDKNKPILEENNHLIINGDVVNDAVIETTGNITIKGIIEDSTIKCKGTLKVKGGIIGSSRITNITADGGINTTFIQNSRIQSKNTIEIQQFIMNSTVRTSDQVIMNAVKSRIVGGTTHAFNGITVGILGSPSLASTKICVGFDSSFKDDINLLYKEKNEKFKEVELLKTKIGSRYFDNPTKYIQTLNSSPLKSSNVKLNALKENLNDLKHILEQLKLLNQKTKQVQSKFYNQNATILVKGEIYKNVIIQISKEKIQASPSLNQIICYYYNSETKKIETRLVEKKA